MRTRQFLVATVVLVVCSALFWLWTSPTELTDAPRDAETKAREGTAGSLAARTKREAPSGQVRPTPTPLQALGWKLPTDEEAAEMEEPFEAVRGRVFYDFRTRIRQEIEPCLPQTDNPRMHMVQFMIRDMGIDELRKERKYEVESVDVTEPGRISDDVYHCLQNAEGMRVEVPIPERGDQLVKPESMPEMIDFNW